VGAGSASARIGVASHIHAASPKGPRYKAEQTKAERQAESNGLWLCQSCSKLVDSDDSGHTAAELSEWKAAAERRAKAELGLATGQEVFRLRDGDQTTYINLPRYREMLTLKGFSVAGLPASNRPLLESEGILASTVLTLESVLKAMMPQALPISHIKNIDQCAAAVGKLISFTGRFRSSNAPRLKNGIVPVYHPTGDPDHDHVIKKTFGAIELVLPLDSFWYASQSSVGLFRGRSWISVRGIARVHSSQGLKIIASPIWMALPSDPLFD
jgi:hypothetical protein